MTKLISEEFKKAVMGVLNECALNEEHKTFVTHHDHLGRLVDKNSKNKAFELHGHHEGTLSYFTAKETNSGAQHHVDRIGTNVYLADGSTSIFHDPNDSSVHPKSPIAVAVREHHKSITSDVPSPFK